MTFAVGSKFGLSYIAESTYGTTPGSPAMTDLPITGDDLDLTKETFLSNTLRSDREIEDFRHGNRQGGGSLNFELRYGAFDDFLIAALGSTGFTTAATITASTIAFADSNPDTITDSGNGFVTGGFKAGDSITVSGSSSNNGTYTIATVAAGTITLVGTDTLSAESAGASVTITAARKTAKTGVDVDSFSLERRFTDIGVYQVLTGCRVNGFSLSIAPNSIITGSFGILAQDVVNNTSSLDSSPTAAPSNSPFDSFTGSVTIDGSAVSIVTSIELTLNNNLSPAFVVGSPTLQQIFEERANLSGTMSFFLEDETILNDFRNETEKSAEIRVSDGTNYYDFIIPRFKLGQASAPVSDFGGIIISAPFQALRDSTEGASFRIDKSS